MIRVQREDFDVGRELNDLTAGKHGIGGIVSFVGVVRDFVGREREKGAPVAAMTLEHYPAMTERQLSEIEAEATSRWPLEASLIVHRLGFVNPFLFGLQLILNPGDLQVVRKLVLFPVEPSGFLDRFFPLIENQFIFIGFDLRKSLLSFDAIDPRLVEF